MPVRSQRSTPPGPVSRHQSAYTEVGIVLQADLSQDTLAALAAEHLGHPHLRSDWAEQRGHHRLATAGLDHMQHRGW
jgi:hypothetical protein